MAIKRFKNSDSASLKAYHKELEVMKMLSHYGSHPNIIQMIGTFQNLNYSFIILEKAFHGNVYQFLRKNQSKIDIKIKLRWVLQIAQALAFMHYHHDYDQIWHRDIKAENILITSLGSTQDCTSAKICDFG